MGERVLEGPKIDRAPTLATYGSDVITGVSLDSVQSLELHSCCNHEPGPRWHVTPPQPPVVMTDVGAEQAVIEVRDLSKS